MKRHMRASIIEGEIYGAPVPAGWPNRGPFRIVAQALARLFGRREDRESDEGRHHRRDGRSEPDK